MQRKSIIITMALVLGLALGIIFGPSVRDSIASAQTQTPSQAQAATPGDTLRNLFLDKLAAALNIQRPALNSAITSAGNSTADAAVQQGTLTQAQADALKARIAAGDTGALWGGHGGPGGPGGPRLDGVQQAISDATAKALNITTDELKTQLRSRQTLAQLAQAHGTTEQAVITAAVAAAKTPLAQAVTNGTVTQAQADAITARIQAGDLGLFGGRGGPGGPGGPHLDGVQQAIFDAAAKALNITTDELKTQLRSGQTLAQLALAHGTTEQAVTTAALAAAKTQLAQAVTNGTVTQAQADTIYTQLQQQGAQLLMPHGRGDGFRSGPGQPAAPTTPQAPAANPSA
jgi:energy-converting hydrogenase A subunit M